MLADDEYWFAVSPRISGDGFDPTTVQALLGITPTYLGIKGEPRLGKDGRRYAPYKTNFWTHSVGASRKVGFDDQIDMLFQTLKGRLNVLSELAHREDVEAELFCGFGSGNGQGGDTIRPETMRILADIGLSLSLDLYPPTVNTDEDDAKPEKTVD